MDLNNLKKVKPWEKYITKLFHIVIIRMPSDDWPNHDPIKDFVMAYHYCRNCRQHRFDRHFDPLSKAGRFRCGGCGVKFKDRGEGLGILHFTIQECAIHAFDDERSYLMAYLVFMKLMIFGLGKYLPNDRGGKTSGELECKANVRLLGWFWSYLKMLY